jgi:hypothetical protein
VEEFGILGIDDNRGKAKHRNVEGKEVLKNEFEIMDNIWNANDGKRERGTGERYEKSEDERTILEEKYH